MPKVNAPLPLLLSAHVLEQLLGNQYQALLQSIQRLENASQTLALEEDSHSAVLAGLYGLCYEGFVGEPHVQKSIAEVFAHCLPLYQLSREDKPLEAFEWAKRCLAQAIELLKKSSWSRRYTALEYLNVIETHYHEALEDFSASPHNPERLKPHQLQVGCAVLAAGYYRIDIETARKVLCMNEYGEEVKTNAAGSHAVCGANGVHYKPNPKSTADKPKMPINPGKEYAVSTLMQLIAGHQLAAAPSTLLSIQHVPLDHKPGDDAETPRTTQGLVQAGLTIGGMCFEDFLECREAINVLKERLTLKDVAALLADGQQGFQTALRTAQLHYPQVFSAENSTEEAQSEALRLAFEDITAQTPPKQQLRDMKESQGRPEKNRRHTFRYLLSSYLQKSGKLEHFQALLGIVHHYPGIMADNEIVDILLQLKPAQRLFKLFPRAPLAQALVDIDAILTPKYLDTEALSALWIGLLLSLPCDAKFDNFMLELRYDSKQSLQSCRIVSIDNDLSLKMPFSLNEKQQLCLEIKNLLIALPELMNQPLHPAVRRRFLSMPAEAQWLLWLSIVARRDNDYAVWERQGMVTHRALNAIDVPALFSSEVLAFMQTQWQALYALVEREERPTHGQCLQYLYPAVVVAYKSLAEMAPDSVLQQKAKLYQFFGMGGSCPLEQLITDEKALQGILIEARAQCASAESEPPSLSVVSAQSLCEQRLQSMNWQMIPEQEQWPWVEAFALLPNLSAQDWQGSAPAEIEMGRFIQGWFQQAVQRGNPFVAQVMLDLGAKVNHCDESKQTALHHLCRHYLSYANSDTVYLMSEVLLGHHSCQPNQYNAQGYTPLLQWVNATPEPTLLKPDELKSAELLLAALVRHGANLEAKDSVKHETALDKILKTRVERPYWFIQLVEKSAGVHADGKSLLAFEARIAQAGGILQPRLAECFGILMRRNLSFAWYKSQGILESKKSKTARVMIRGADTGEVYLPVAIEERLLTAKRAFNIEGETTEYGRRVVKAIHHEGAHWHVKEHPEMPGVETAVKLFSQQLFGEHTAPNELFAFFDQKEHPYPVLISQTVPGENLQQVLNYPAGKFKAVLNGLSFQALSEQIILAMLIHPEDGKPDNYQVLAMEQEGQPTYYRIVGIDNDHAFVQAVTNKQGTRELQVKCVLFCFDAMRQAVHSAVRERILALSADAFLQEWLMHLDGYQSEAKKLFDKKARKELFKSAGNALKVALGQARERLPVVVTIPFRARAITELWDRFTQLQEVLRKQPTITHLQLLKRVTPSLGVRYEEVFELYEEGSEVAERFHDIAKTHYSTAIAGRYATLTTSKQALEAMGLSEQEQRVLVKEEGNGADGALSPQSALKELRQTLAQKGRMKSIIEGIYAGAFEGFSKIPSLRLKEFILAQLDFSQITLAHSKEPDIKKQEALLKIIISENTCFQNITLQHCAALTDEHVITLLKNSPGLRKLKLVNCPQLTGKIGAAIEKYAPTVVSLSLVRLPQVLFIGTEVWGGRFNRKVDYQPINLQQLTRLNISEMLQLERIMIQCPQLRLATTNRNAMLRAVTLLSEHLQAWDMSYCDMMGDEALVKGAHGCSSIGRLNIQGCRGIQSPLFLYVSEHAPFFFPLVSPKQWIALSQQVITNQDVEKIHNGYMKEFNKARVDLRQRNLNEVECVILASVLNRYSAVKILNLAGNRLSLSIVALLMRALEENISLEILDVCCCDLPDEAATALLNLLQKHTTLNFVNISGNPCSEKIKNEMIACCFQRCEKSNDHALLQHYLEFYEIQIGTIDFVGDNPSYAAALLKWSDVAEQLNMKIMAKEIRWLSFEPTSCAAFDLSISDTQDNIAADFSTVSSTLEGSGSVVTLIQLADGRLASGSNDRTIKIWDVATGTCVDTLEGHSRNVNALTQLADGRLASGSEDSTIRLWDVATGTCVATLKGHSSDVYALIQLADGRLASGSQDYTIKIWDVNTHECADVIFVYHYDAPGIEELYAPTVNRTFQPNSFAQLIDGRLVSGGYCSMAIKIWDVNLNGTLSINCGAVFDGGNLYTLIQLRDGHLVIGMADHLIIWNVNTRCRVFTDFDIASAKALTQLVDGRLAIGSSEGNIIIWEIKRRLIVSLDVSFRFECAALLALQKQQTSLVFALLPKLLPSAESLRLLQELKTFVDALLYNCYARNKLLFAVKITIDEQEHRLSVVCPKEELASSLYDCLKAFCYPTIWLKSFLELLTSDKAGVASKIEEKKSTELPQGLPSARMTMVSEVPETTEATPEPALPLISTAQSTQWNSEITHRHGTFAHPPRNSATFFGSRASASPFSLSSSSASSAASSSSSFFHPQPPCPDVDAIPLTIADMDENLEVGIKGKL